MGDVLTMPVDYWGHHVRLVTDYIIRHDAERAEKFFATETRRVSVALKAEGRSSQEINDVVERFVADVHVNLEHRRRLFSEGHTARIYSWRASGKSANASQHHGGVA